MHALSFFDSTALPNACLLSRDAEAYCNPKLFFASHFDRFVKYTHWSVRSSVISSQGNTRSASFVYVHLLACPFDCFPSLTLALKVRRGGEDGDALVHGPLADPQVVIDPFLQTRCFCELFWLNTGTVPSPEGERVYVSATFYVWFVLCSGAGRCVSERVAGSGVWSTAGEEGEGFRVFARGGRSGPT
jgi:hypothetical protein